MKGFARLRTRRRHAKPRVLVCTPEITELPEGMGNAANYIQAKGGGLGDISAGLIRKLHEDDRFQLHVAIPKYDTKIRGMTRASVRELDFLAPSLHRRGIHLVRDSAFSTLPGVYDESAAHPRIRRAEAYQRYVIMQLLDDIQPDIVHCNDWMTGLIPPAARERGIKSIFTLHNVFTEYETPANLDRGGIDIARFMKHLYFERFPVGRQDTWFNNRVDFTASGIHAADVVNTVSPTFLREIVEGWFDDIIPPSIRESVRHKFEEGKAYGILNAPNDTIDPRHGRYIVRYGVDDVVQKKRINKRIFQERMGLAVDADAPLFLWPNRLYSQKGPDILLECLEYYVREHGIQVAVVANGDTVLERTFQRLQATTAGHVARRPFSEELGELGKAGSDFVLMPSLYEPCGLPQMEAPRFGTLPLARATGGLRDTVIHLDPHAGTGNGFAFEHYNAQGLSWAIDEALAFHALPADLKADNVRRIMRESFEQHTLENTAKAYVTIYDQMLEA